jgi:hypothetical protein
MREANITKYIIQIYDCQDNYYAQHRGWLCRAWGCFSGALKWEGCGRQLKSSEVRERLALDDEKIHVG